MTKYTIRITESGYKKLQKKLQKYDIKIGGMNIRNFLIANSVIEDHTSPTYIRIKRIILHIKGDFDSQPVDLQNDNHLETHLGFAYNQYFLLRKGLDQLVKYYDKEAKISAQEAAECRLVEDCINLVNSKIFQERLEIF